MSPEIIKQLIHSGLQFTCFPDRAIAFPGLVVGQQTMPDPDPVLQSRQSFRYFHRYFFCHRQIQACTDPRGRLGINFQMSPLFIISVNGDFIILYPGQRIGYITGKIIGPPIIRIGHFQRITLNFLSFSIGNRHLSQIIVIIASHQKQCQ